MKKCAFFEKRVRKGKEAENPEVRLQFGKGHGRSLVNAAAVGRQSLPVADGLRALLGCPLHGYSSLCKYSAEPSPDV